MAIAFRIRWAVLAAAVWAFAACGGGGATTPTPAPQPPSPAGNKAQVFALMDPGETSASLASYAALATVDGLAVRTDWRTLEPAYRAYDWTTLDAALAAAAGSGKKVGLHIVASGYGRAPAWLPEQGMKSYSYAAPSGATVSDAVPWDTVFLAEWSTFVSAASVHLRSTGAQARLAYLSVAVPVPEMSLPGCAGGMLGGSVAYDRAQYRDAWKSTISAMHAAFPGVPKLLPVPVATICRPDTDGPAFYLELLDFALSLEPAGFAFYATDLDASGSARMSGVLHSPAQAPVALQFTAAMGTRLQAAVCAGLQTFGATLFEAYKADLSSDTAAVKAGVSSMRAGCP